MASLPPRPDQPARRPRLSRRQRELLSIFVARHEQGLMMLGGYEWWEQPKYPLEDFLALARAGLIDYETWAGGSFRAQVTAAGVAWAVQHASGETNEECASRRQAIVVPLLEKKGWTWGHLSSETGVSPASIYGYRDGKRALSASNRELVAAKLGIPVRQLPD